MSRRVRAVVSTALVVLVCAGGSNASLGASSSVAASLEVVASRGAVGVGYDQSPDLAAPSRIAFEVPERFGFSPGANGAAVGSFVGSDEFDSAADPRQLLTGALTIADPASFTAEGKVCTGSSVHDAVWAASAGAPGATAVSIPIFVDGRTFTICPDARALGGTPIGIGLQFGLVSNGGIDRPLVTAPTGRGRFVWRATVTWQGQHDAELLNIVDLPQRATFRAKVVRGNLEISGRVVADGHGIAHVRVAAFVDGSGRHPIVNGRSGADGRFMLTHRLGRGAFAVRVNSYSEQRNVTASECAGHTCASATEMILVLRAAPGTIHVRSTGRR
jgi:hypothetical protein